MILCGCRPERRSGLRAQHGRALHSGVDLPIPAARALDAIRRTGRNVRFEVKKACEQERWRLKVMYDHDDAVTGEPVTIALGLLWSDDRAAVVALRERLERGEPGTTA